MNFETWLSFAILETLLCLTPGPAVIFTTSTAAMGGGREGMAAAGGILASNLLYFALSATGIAAVLTASGRLFTALRWAGGFYLVWTGLSLIFRNSSTRPRLEPYLRDKGAFLQGFLVQSANPKSLVFFAALLPQFIIAEAAVLPQMLILGITSVVIELSVLSSYVLIALHVKHYVGGKGLRVFHVLAGAFLVFAGSKVAFLTQL